MDKRPFDIDVALDRIEEAVRPWPKAALFQLAEEGFTSTFEQLPNETGRLYSVHTLSRREKAER